MTVFATGALAETLVFSVREGAGMATKRVFRCDECHWQRNAGALFPALLAMARERPKQCAQCSRPATLRLSFDFGLNATDNESEVSGCYLPKKLERWVLENDDKVVFYPFLVILQRRNREQAVWLPYFHTVKSDDGLRDFTKYGQWAPFMDMHLFDSLLLQAHSAGFLKHFH